jgi:RNA polymerase II-associated protein 1
VTAALHHHGENPEAAGYTLDELFHLSRATILQQRVIALQTIANIIRQVKH